MAGSKFIVPLSLLEINSIPSLPPADWHKLYMKAGYLKVLKTSEKDVVLDRPLSGLNITSPCSVIQQSDTVLQAFGKLQCQISNIPVFTQVNADWNALTGVQAILNKPLLSAVATSGDYNDLLNLPVMPSAQVNSDWNAVSGVEEILNKPVLSAVATSGDYNDLINTPAAPPASSNYGLYTQLEDYSVGNTVVPSTLVGPGLGTLSIPANTFQQGDTFKCVIEGKLNSQNNNQIRFTIVANGGSIVLADTGGITLPSCTNEEFKLELTFVIREIGAAGVARIMTTGFFTYIRDAAVQYQGYGFTSENTTTFDTTVMNTLDIFTTWSAASLANVITSQTLTLQKVF